MSSRDRLADKWSLTHRQDKALNAKLVGLADGNLETSTLGCGGICCNSRKLVSVEGGDCSKRSNFCSCFSVVLLGVFASCSIACPSPFGVLSVWQPFLIQGPRIGEAFIGRSEPGQVRLQNKKPKEGLLVLNTI